VRFLGERVGAGVTEIVLEEPVRQLGAAVGEWHALAGRLAGCSYFQTPDWVLNWWNHRGRPRTVVALWRDGHGELDAVAFLSELREPWHHRLSLSSVVVTNAGSGHPYLADRCGWPVSPGRRDDVREWAAAYRPGTSLLLRDLDPRTGVSCVPKGSRCVLRTPAPVLDLTDDPEAHRAKNLSEQIPRYLRGLERMGVSFTWIPPKEMSADAVDVLFDLHESRYRAKGESTFNRDVHGDFHRTLIDAAVSDQGPAMVLAAQDGRPIAVQYGFVWQDTFYQYQGGWDASFAKRSIGTVVVAEAIRLARENGLHYFDFLRGDERHKYRFGATDVFDETWLLPRGLRSQPLVWSYGLTNASRKRRRAKPRVSSF
jgi:CelD/BcsL family acetyltransferase involved in cellulose biosynthesis